MKHKSCFTNAHCCFECPNAAADEFEVTVAITESVESGMRIADLCEDCQLQVYSFINIQSNRNPDPWECQGNIGG